MVCVCTLFSSAILLLRMAVLQEIEVQNQALLHAEATSKQAQRPKTYQDHQGGHKNKVFMKK